MKTGNFYQTFNKNKTEICRFIPQGIVFLQKVPGTDPLCQNMLSKMKITIKHHVF